MRNVLLAVFFVFSTLLQPMSFASTGNGNGGDSRRPDHDSAWFLGATRKVSACVDASPAFGLSPDQLEAEILAALAVWRDYLAAKNASEASPRLATEYRFLSGCDGKEDIRFHFGTSDAAVERAKKAYFNPIGFAERTSYDLGKGWGKGFIWVAGPGRAVPNWQAPGSLRALLIHELGHVLGVSHVEGTIMSASIGDQILAISKNPELASRLGRIDQQRELLYCKDCALELDGRLGSREEQSQATNFKLLTGHAPKSKVQAKVRSKSDRLELWVSDGSSTATFAIAYNNDLIAITGDAEVFARVLGDTGKRQSYRAPEIRIRTGSIQGADGKSHSVLISRNGSIEQGRLGVSFLSKAGIQFPLFIAEGK